jgi:prevent-host-death family protein
MVDISLAQAKAQLSELVARAAAGEVVRTTKRGKPVAQITPVPAPRQPIDFAPPQKRLTDSLPADPEPPPTSSAGCETTIAMTLYRDGFSQICRPIAVQNSRIKRLIKRPVGQLINGLVFSMETQNRLPELVEKQPKNPVN